MAILKAVGSSAMYSDSWLLKIDIETAPGAFLMLNLESGSIRLDKFDYFFFKEKLSVVMI